MDGPEPGRILQPFSTPRDRVVDMVRRAVESRQYQSGQRLPSERKLAEQAGVSRTAARNALQILENEGVVEQTPPRGWRVVAAENAGAAGVLAQTILLLTKIYLHTGEDVNSTVGTEDRIAHGAVGEIHRSGRHAFHIDPSNIQASDIYALTGSLPPSGLIAMGTGMEDPAALRLIDAWRCQGVPCVVHGDVLTSELDECQYDRVISDHEAGSYALTKWLIEQGFRRPRLFWGASNRKAKTLWMRCRERGYRKACMEAGIEAPPPIESPAVDLGGATGQAAHDIASRYMTGVLTDICLREDRPDALLAISDGLVFSLAAACQRLGLTPGRDIAIAGYDDYWRQPLVYKPFAFAPIATVNKNNTATGQALAQLLFDRMSGKLPPEPQTRIVPPRLVVTADDNP